MMLIQPMIHRVSSWRNMIRALPLLTACVVFGIVWPPSAALPLPHLHSAAESDVCVNAPPATNFTNKAYEGTWFEIAKYQTAGGAFFERNCVCTEVVTEEAKH